jgi:hypothetical protein
MLAGDDGCRTREVLTVDRASERTFVPADQSAFASLSGDWNPIHLDPVFARRTLTGGAVVHGMHALLWALDRWTGALDHARRIRVLKASFIRPMRVGSMLTVVPVRSNASLTALEIRTGRSPVATFEFESTSSERTVPGDAAPGNAPCAEPIDRSLAELTGCAGSFPLSVDVGAACALFPSLVRVLPHDQLAALLGISRLTGMECPGLHSLLSEMELVDSGCSDPVLTYRVAEVDARFSLVRTDIQAPGFSGTVRAFLRPKPSQQPGYAAVRGHVGRNEFSGERALVVGGSRGLGELTAKILAAGGADVTLTYSRGAAEAAHIVAEITSGGGVARAVPFDVERDEVAALHADHPTSLYYFATPFVFSGTRHEFSDDLLARFRRHYVTAFERSVEQLATRGVRRVFYPSTVAIDEAPPDMREYVCAKTEGERLCAALEARCPGLVIARPRLPRLATDQTATQMPVRQLPALPVMLEAIRALHTTG